MSQKSMWEKIKEFFGFSETSDLAIETEPEKPQLTNRPFKGTLINSSNAHQFSPAEIKVVEPRLYEDSLNIAMYLRENVPVVVNLKYLDTNASKRLIDFVCGTAYAINGHMMKIGENIFIFTPANVLIVDSAEKTAFEHGVEQEEREVFFKRAAG